MPPKANKKALALPGKGNIPSNLKMYPLPAGILVEDKFDARGMPTEIVPPPHPKGHRLIFIVGQRGGFHWYNVTTREMYTRDTVVKGVPRILCSTLSFPSKERPPRAEQIANNTERKRYKCAGQMVPYVEHNQHTDGVSVDVLKHHLFDMAMRAMFALYGEKMKPGQIELFADYFSLMILGKSFHETGLELFPKKYHDLASLRAMYKEEYKRFPSCKLPITDHKIKHVPSLAEAIVRVLWVRGGEIIDIIRPTINLSHPGSRELGFPDREAPYELELQVPGNCFLFQKTFILGRALTMVCQ